MKAELTPQQVFNAAVQAVGHGKLAQAEKLCTVLLKAHPRHAEAWGVMAEVLARSARKPQAVAAYQHALAAKPRSPVLNYNFAMLLRGMGQQAEAQAHYRVVLQEDSGHAMARLNLAGSLHSVGRTDEAVAEVTTLTSLQPGFALGWATLSWLRLLRREIDAAVECAQRGVDTDPHSGVAQFRLAEALCLAGETARSLPHFDRAVELLPKLGDLRSKRLLMLTHMPGLPVQDLVDAHRAEGEKIREEAGPPLPARAAAAPNGDGRIRVGYVSPDFLSHAVSTFFRPALMAHDRKAVALYGYYTQPDQRGGVDAIAQAFDQWRACAAMSDAELAQQIRADGIDILIDLSGHTSHHRLGVFARRPAPLQWQWFGYPLLTGLAAFDARLTDHWLDPLGRNPAGEKLLYLPSRLVWGPGAGCPPVAPSPALAGQPFTFGSFNSLRKMNPGLLDAWVRVLQGVPGSRLRMGHMDSNAFEQGFRAQLDAAGVDSSRLEVLPKMPMRQYLEAHDQIDLMLDGFPYNGGTTTAHALWQGVPVVTLAGEYGPQRTGASLILQLGLGELLTHAPEEYVARSIELAGQVEKLQAWRASLRERFLAAPLGQPRTVVAALETLMASELERMAGA